MAIASKNYNPTKKLSILIAQDGLSFCISESQPRLTVTHFTEKNFTSKRNPELLLEELKNLFNYTLAEEVAHIQQLSVIYANNLFSIVPKAFFNKNHLTDYLKFNIKLLSTDEIAVDEIKHLHAYNVYIPYTNINNYLFEKFGEFHYTHASSLLLEKNIQQNPHEGQTSVFVNVFPTQFNICIAEKSKLLLCNSFDYDTAEDFIYYLLFTLEQLDLDTETIHLKLSGKIVEDSKIYEYLHAYVRNISFTNSKLLNLTILPSALKEEAFYKNNLLLSSLT